MIKTLGRTALKKAGLYGSYSLLRKGPLLEDGWFRSFDEGMPVDASGAPLPFLNYPVISFLAGRVHREMHVFEYGSGFSTLWWAARVASIVACEHNAAWHARICALAPANATIVHVPLDAGYSSYAARFPGRFDILVIDGRNRVECVHNSLDCLTPGGVVIWDDIQREKYREGFVLLESRGFKRLDFEGLVPSLNERGYTAVFYCPGNCLSL